ncbi:uncharacterized mitochondrial protein-like protein [Tanacetum coccineum]
MLLDTLDSTDVVKVVTDVAYIRDVASVFMFLLIPSTSSSTPRCIDFSRPSLRDAEGAINDWIDASYLSDPYKAKSQTGYVFLNRDTTITWRSQKQTLVATSSNHAEVIALHEASRECVWLRSMTQLILTSCELEKDKNPTLIYEDNSACVSQMKKAKEDPFHWETIDAAAAATRVYYCCAPVSTAGVTISTAEPRTPPTTTIVFDDEDVTMEMAQTLIKMKEHKAKEKGIAITDVEDSSRIVRPVRSITTLQPLPTIDPKDKGKGVLVEEEPVKIKMRDQAKIDADYELAIRLTHKEQEKYTIKERARLLAEFFDQRKKQLAAARAEAIRNKPPTKTQVRNRMITYLKHMGKYTHQQLKNKTYEEIQRLYEKEKRKRAGEKKSEESAKKKKLEDVVEEQESTKSDEETTADYEHGKEELRMWLIVVSDEEETVDLKIFSAKYPIVDWESQNLGNVDMEDLHVYKRMSRWEY